MRRGTWYTAVISYFHDLHEFKRVSVYLALTPMSSKVIAPNCLNASDEADMHSASSSLFKTIETAFSDCPDHLATELSEALHIPPTSGAPTQIVIFLSGFGADPQLFRSVAINMIFKPFSSLH